MAVVPFEGPTWVYWRSRRSVVPRKTHRQNIWSIHPEVPRQIIPLGVWLDFQFSFSLREFEELTLESGDDVMGEIIQRRTVKFGLLNAHGPTPR